MSLAIFVGFAAKEQYTRTLQSTTFKWKKCEKVYIKADTHTGTLAPPALGHTPSFLLPASFPLSPFCYLLLCLSSYCISLICTTFFQPLPVGWLLQHLLSFWTAGSISQNTCQADASIPAAGTAK